MASNKAFASAAAPLMRLATGSCPGLPVLLRRGEPASRSVLRTIASSVPSFEHRGCMREQPPPCRRFARRMSKPGLAVRRTDVLRAAVLRGLDALAVEHPAVAAEGKRRQR